MDIYERLRSLGVEVGSGRVIRLAPKPRAEPSVPIDQVIKGTYARSAWGECFVTERYLPLTYRHGRVLLNPAGTYSSEAAALLAGEPSLSDIPLDQLAFLDTETTGLSGGTGTYVFLVGIGYLEGAEFRLQQFFLRDCDQEKALLATINDLLERFRGIVTFNGKAFDWPLLTTRFVYSRLPMGLVDPPHLDLLFPSRRLWRRRLESCALPSLERHILGVEREEDVPSWLIPSLYFQYLRLGDASCLRQVFYHNVQDVVSLLALIIQLCAILTNPFEGLVNEPEDFLSLGMLFEKTGRTLDSQRAYEMAADATAPPEVREKARRRLGFLLKRTGHLEKAAKIWVDLIATKPGAALYPYVELAKYYEHHQHDYLAAEACVSRALAVLDWRRAVSETDQDGAEARELERRQQRLRRKLQSAMSR
ncbi:MAG: ribonuclease H-like domain-containing protein [Chloroflexi bacterium]|nr:ribonuclease H-like domain-containing protein [Chloroflexota bacterium]